MTPTHQRKNKRNQKSPTARSNDIAIYIAFILVGVFIALIAWLLDFDVSWREITLGYCGALAVLINLYAFNAYQGKKLANWQQALARLPLRFAGFGKRGAKPLEAAHNSEHAKAVIFISISICVLILLGLSVLLIPDFRI